MVRWNLLRKKLTRWHDTGISGDFFGPYCHQGSFRNLLGADEANEAARRLVSLEYQVGSHTPPVFLWHTSTDDAVPVKNSYLW